MADPRQIPTERKVLFYGGMALSAVGLLMFLSWFVLLASSFGNHHDSSAADWVPKQFMITFAGMILMAIGRGMMNVGSKGLSGAGIVLDPEQARRDVEPWSRMAGGVLNDALSEVDAVQQLTAPKNEAPVIKVRCPRCKALNDEQAKFCDQCGGTIVFSG